MLVCGFGGWWCVLVCSPGDRWSGRRPVAWSRGSAWPCSDSRSSRSCLTCARLSTSASTWYGTAKMLKSKVVFLFFFSIFLSFLVGWFVWSVVRWWVWLAPPVWRTGCHSSTSALTCLRLCPLAPPWSDWLLCRFRYGEMTLSNTHS